MINNHMIPYTKWSVFSTGAGSGEWTDWSSWSSCTQSCNTGEQFRTRQCQGGWNCEGSERESQGCNEQACPNPGSSLGRYHSTLKEIT